MHPRAAVFDLGGVVIDVAAARALAAWAPRSRLPPDQLRERFGIDEPYRRHERGQLACEDYFAHVRERLSLDAGIDDVRAGWNAILGPEIGPTVSLIDRLRAGGVPCYAFSNTNATHLREIERALPALLPRFTRVFASHAIGMRKPDREAFEHVIREIGLEAGEILFFDDRADNVDAARACGMQAVLVRGPADVLQAVVRHGWIEG